MKTAARMSPAPARDVRRSVVQAALSYLVRGEQKPVSYAYPPPSSSGRSRARAASVASNVQPQFKAKPLTQAMQPDS